MTGYAFFVERPRRIDDLLQPHPVEAEAQFEVVKTIRLSKIDYENFITDMVADRAFLEENAHLCRKDGTAVLCLLVKPREGEDGILVVPDGAWVDLAAVFP